MVILNSCPFTMNELKKIFTLMENSVCRIEIIDNKTAIVNGTPSLHCADVQATDLRGGAGALIAALAAPGKSTISNIAYIDRGYESIEKQLTDLGASIIRKNFTNP